MTCDDALELVHGYLDGELDLVKSLEIEQHLAACAACKVRFDQERELGSGIRAHAAYYAAPPALRARVASALPQDPGPRWRDALRRWAPAAAMLALGALLGVGLAWLRPGDEQRVLQEVVASHVRSLMADHLTDVASSDQHTVKPWIDGKLDFAPPVANLAAQGFPLAGGRLDYVDGRGVMALIYRRHAHVINLFVWPQATGAESGVRADSRHGYNVAHFDRAGMAFWAVSDLNQEEFTAFVALLREQLAGAR